MSEYYVDVRLTFQGEPDEWDDGHEVIDLTHIERLNSTLPEDEIEGLTETLAQSDFAFIGLPYTLIAALEGGKHEVDKRIY